MIGKTINIIASAALSEIRLDDLIGAKGVIVENGPHNNGAYVKLERPYLNEEEWFIPKDSIQIVKQ